MESSRQASLLVAHQFYGVPVDQKFVLNDIDLQIIDMTGLRIGAEPGQALLRSAVGRPKNRNGQLVGFSMHIDIVIDGNVAATVDITIQWMPGAAWDRLRERGRTGLVLSPPRAHDTARRLAPGAVGRSFRDNVVVGDVSYDNADVIGHVIVDHTHPALFDHPLDHIPGMLVLEAIRQTSMIAAHDVRGLAAERLAPTRCRTAFTRFGEFELATDCRARVVDEDRNSGITRVRADVTQENVSIASADVELATVCRASSTGA